MLGVTLSKIRAAAQGAAAREAGMVPRVGASNLGAPGGPIIPDQGVGI